MSEDAHGPQYEASLYGHDEAMRDLDFWAHSTDSEHERAVRDRLAAYIKKLEATIGMVDAKAWDRALAAEGKLEKAEDDLASANANRIAQAHANRVLSDERDTWRKVAEFRGGELLAECDHWRKVAKTYERECTSCGLAGSHGMVCYAATVAEVRKEEA